MVRNIVLGLLRFIPVSLPWATWIRPAILMILYINEACHHDNPLMQEANRYPDRYAGAYSIREQVQAQNVHDAMTCHRSNPFMREANPYLDRYAGACSM